MSASILTLSSGTKVYVEPARELPVVNISIGFAVGSANDPDGQEGLFRSAMRMLRRGAGKLTAGDIEASIDRLGAEMALDIASSFSSIHAQVLRRNLQPFTDLLTTLLSEPAFSEDEFERLRRDTVAEIIEGRDNDRSLVQRAFRRSVFALHPFGRRTTRASIERLSRDGLRDAYEQKACVKNLVLAFSGDLDEKEARDLGERIVKALPKPKEPAVRSIPEPTLQKGRHLVFVDKPERSQSQILIGGLGSRADDPDHFPLLVANAIFGGTFTSRMMREIRSKRGWSYGASSRLGVDCIRQDFAMWAFPAAQDTAPCIALELGLLNTFREKGISAKELAFIRQYLVRSHAFDIDTAQKRMQQFMDATLLGLPEGYFTDFRKNVNAVTLESANQAVKDRISTDDLKVVVVGTFRDIGEKVQSVIPDLVKTTVWPFDDD